MAFIRSSTIHGVLGLIVGPLGVWVYISIIRDMVLTYPDGPATAAGFVLGLMLGPLLWFALKLSWFGVRGLFAGGRRD